MQIRLGATHERGYNSRVSALARLPPLRHLPHRRLLRHPGLTAGPSGGVPLDDPRLPTSPRSSADFLASGVSPGPGASPEAGRTGSSSLGTPRSRATRAAEVPPLDPPLPRSAALMSRPCRWPFPVKTHFHRGENGGTRCSQVLSSRAHLYLIRAVSPWTGTSPVEADGVRQ